ncbi:oligosaccharide flippase family protein [Salinibius halmophilus]|uniref:oligosaccharide flippase family protein n=1 Tax=Salinibius halmophilus TaxID=1853216 RepID=UPI000E6677B9|nr:oligosaccharide flippase family protein [Salinibius halmophilus]
MSVNLNSLIKSSSILLFAKLFQKIIGLIVLMILARVLTPDEFGIIIFCTIVIQLFNILAVSGSDQYIISKDNPSENDINSAWTLDIVLKGSLYFILFITAPFIDLIVEDTNLTLAIRVLGLILLFEALQNPGLFLLRKQHKYLDITKYQVISRLFSTIMLVLIALKYKSYWAFIVADMTYWAFFLLSTYKFSNYRPRLDISRVREQMNFSKWMLSKGILGYIRSQSDSFYISKIIGTEALGEYGSIKNNVLLIILEILRPITEPLLASFSHAKNNITELATKVNITLTFIASLTAPIAAYIYFFPELTAYILLGSNWPSAPGILQAISPVIFLAALPFVTNAALTSVGRVKDIFIWELLSLFVVLLIIPVSVIFTTDLVKLAWARFLSEAILIPTLIIICYVRLGISAVRLKVVVFPIIVSSACAYAVKYLTDYQSFYVAKLDNYSELSNIGFFQCLVASSIIFLFTLTLYSSVYIAIILTSQKTEEYKFIKNKILLRIPGLRNE